MKNGYWMVQGQCLFSPKPLAWIRKERGMSERELRILKSILPSTPKHGRRLFPILDNLDEDEGERQSEMTFDGELPNAQTQKKRTLISASQYQA